MFLVRDLAFYNAGCHEPKGVRRSVVPFRRVLRRMLRPVFLRQVELFRELFHRVDHLDHSLHALRHELNALAQRQDELSEQLKTTLAFGWDHVAMVRRLAVLEDLLAASSSNGTGALGGDESDSRSSILFPGLNSDRDARGDEPEARSKVS